jgi:beta-N-acetylhexosaminidase
MGGWPPARVAAEGKRIGAALHALGVNLNLAPVLDSAVGWDGQPSWMGRRGRAFGRTAAEILPRARAFAAGCREANVACLAKHFPGYDVAADSDREPARSGASAAAVTAAAERFAAVSDVTVGVMMASIVYPAVGARPAVLEPALVGRARQAVGEGLIMTDDLWGTALRAWQRPDLQILPASYPQADWLALGEQALRAGNDLLLITYPARAAQLQDLLAARLAEDPRLRQIVRAAARRVLLVKQRLGLLRR